MADEIVSQLALDATKVLSAFAELQAAFAKHSQSIQLAVSAMGTFNRAEAGMAPAIDVVNRKLSEQAKFAADTATQLRNVFTGRIDSTATLTEIKKVNDAFAALERTLVSTKAAPDQVNKILGNLAGSFTGTDAKIQSALIAAKNATAGLGASNAAGTLNINQAAIQANAKAQAAAEAQALAAASATASRQVATQLSSNFSTIGADQGAINRFQTAVQRFQQVAQKSGLSSDQLKGVIGNLGTVFTGAEGKVANAALAVNKFGGALQGVQTTASGFGANLQSVLKVFTFQQALAGLGALQGAFSSSIPGAIAFERALAQISTISDAGDKNLDSLGVRVTLLANEFGKPAPEVAAGLYHALSNQVGDTGQTVQFLTEALKFSKAAVTDVGSSVDALSAVQNAYGQSSQSASHNADVLFRTIDLGRVSAKELGDSFGRILPIAATLGVSLEEVSAAISTATVQGVKFQDAQTQILNLLIASLKPTGDFKKRMDELGFSSTNAGIAAEGFVGFFSKISQAAKGSEELAKLFPNIRGLRGEISLFGESGAKILPDFLDQTTHAAGAAQDAFNRIQFSNAEQVSNELARIQNQITQGFGRDAVAALATLNAAFGGVADKVVFMGEALALVFGGAVFLTAGNQLIALLGSLSTAFGGSVAAATKFGLAMGVLTAAFIVTVKAFQSTDFAQQTIDEFEKIRIETAKFATDEANAAREANAPIVAGIKEQVSTLLQSKQQQQAILNSALQSAGAIEAATTSNFKTEVSQRLHAYTTFINSIKALQDNAAQHAVELGQKQVAFNQSIQDAIFAHNQKSRTPEEQATAINQQINKLLASGSSAQAQGNSKFAEQEVEKAKQLAIEFLNLTNNRTLLNKVATAHTALLAQEGQQMRQQVEAAKQLEKSDTNLVEQARIQLELALDLDKQREKLVKSGQGDSPEAKAIETQIKAALSAAEQFQKRLSANAGKVGNNVTGSAVQNAVDALRKTTTGPDLQITFQKGIDNFRSEVERQFKANPLTVELGLKFDPAGTSAIQDQIAKLKDAALKGVDESGGIPGLQRSIGVEKAELIDALKDIGKNAKNAFESSFTLDPTPFTNVVAVAQTAKDKLATFFADANNFDAAGKLTVGGAKNLTAITEPLVQLRKAFTENTNGITEQLGKFAGNSEKSVQLVLDQIPKILSAQQALIKLQGVVGEGDAAQKKLDELSTGVQSKGLSDKTLQGAKLNDLGDQSTLQSKQQLIDIEKELQQADDLTTSKAQTNASQQVNSVSSVASTINNVLDSSLQNATSATINLNSEVSFLGITGENAGQIASAGLSVIGTTAESQVPGVSALTEALFRLAEAQAASSGGGSGFSGSGGDFVASRGAFVQGFANGGLARGTDTVPAMLTPGEIVVNPTASRKFFSQLMAMNAGIQPSFRSNGGSVGDTFGDINVNISANGTSDINARAIAQGIQREMRKRTIRSN